MSDPLPPPVVPGPVPYQPTPTPRVAPNGKLSGATKVVLAVLGCVVFLGLLAGIWLGAQPKAPGPGPASSDVKMESCVVTSYDSPKANLRVHNSTDSERDYVITVVFERSGTQIGSGIATVVDLRPGQTAQAEAVGFGTDTAGSIRCRVSSVRRI